MGRAIAILGMHRSGTSAVARAVNLLGVYLGEIEQLLPASEFNTEGYWEHKGIYQVQEQILDVLGASWDTSVPLPTGWTRLAGVQALKEDLRAIVRAQFADRPLWGWKEPRTSLLLPLWKELLREEGIALSCLVATRNPVDVAASLERRNRFGRAESVAMWLNYTLAAMENSLDIESAILDYDDLVDDWRTNLAGPAKSLGLELPSDEATQLEMSTFLKPSLRHSRSRPEDLKDDRPLEKFSAEVYGLLRRTSEGLIRDEYAVETVRLVERFREMAEALHSAGSYEARLFWPAAGTYSDANSEGSRGSFGHFSSVHEWTVPKLDGSEIRIDPVDSQSHLLVEWIEVCAADNARVLQRWDSASGFVAIRMDRNIFASPREDGLSLLCNTPDPHIYLPVEPTWQTVGALRVRMRCLADRVPAGITHEMASLGIHFENARAQLQDEQKRLRAYEETLRAVREMLDEERGLANPLRSELEVLKPEMRRLNLQLDSYVEHTRRIEEQVHALSAHVHSIESSRVWRLTRPLVRWMDSLKGR